MSSGRSNKLACQVAEFLVCAELARRDLIATPFAGNVPTFDVLATDDFCRTVPIQVKASRSDKWPSQATRWMQIQYDAQMGKQIYSGPAELTTPDLIWVCVAIAAPGAPPARDRFFILTEADLRRVCVKVYTGWMDRIGWKRPRNPASFDCRWSITDIAAFENNWKLITERLAAAQPDSSLASARGNSVAT